MYLKQWYLIRIYLFKSQTFVFLRLIFSLLQEQMNINILSSTKTGHIDQRILFVILDFVKY